MLKWYSKHADQIWTLGIFPTLIILFGYDPIYTILFMVVVGIIGAIIHLEVRERNE